MLVFFWAEFSPKIISSNMNSKDAYKNPGSLYFKINDLKNYNNIDVLFLGSSHSNRGFDTRRFEKLGLKVFNLGSSAQTPIQTNILVKRHIKYLNPKLILYEVYPGTFESDGVESSIDLLINDKSDLNSLKMAFNINSVSTYNALIYSTIKNNINTNDFYEQNYQQGRDTYITGGFVEKEISYLQKKNYDKKQVIIKEKQLRSFKNTLTLLKNKGIEVILVFAPITSSLYNSYTNNKIFDNIMNNSGRYINYNVISKLNDSIHFYDSHHLNQKGVEKFNNGLIGVLNDEFTNIID
jgi:hypothetical protein